MSGLVWIVVWILLTAVAAWRGWFWFGLACMLCIGIGLGQTAVGANFYSGMTTLVGGIGDAAVAAARTMAA